jgi:hypothetical protein
MSVDAEEYIKDIEAVLENIENQMDYQHNDIERIRYEIEESKAICGRTGAEMKDARKLIDDIRTSIYNILQLRIIDMESDIKNIKATQEAHTQILKNIQEHLWDASKSRANGKTAEK